MKTLLINACLRGKDRSRTWRLTEAFLKELHETGCKDMEVIDLCTEDVEPLKGDVLEQRDNAAGAGDFSSPFFDRAKQFAAADRIIVAAPLWDLSFPSMLKVYLENICVTGITFRYTDDGIQGMCRAKRLMYITTRGGDFTLPYMQPMEQATPYLRALCAMLGVEQMDVICADGLDIIGNDVEAILSAAEADAKEKAAGFLAG